MKKMITFVAISLMAGQLMAQSSKKTPPPPPPKPPTIEQHQIAPPPPPPPLPPPPPPPPMVKKHYYKKKTNTIKAPELNEEKVSFVPPTIVKDQPKTTKNQNPVLKNK